jgi:hypothetical protein
VENSYTVLAKRSYGASRAFSFVDDWRISNRYVHCPMTIPRPTSRLCTMIFWSLQGTLLYPVLSRYTLTTLTRPDLYSANVREASLHLICEQIKRSETRCLIPALQKWTSHERCFILCEILYVACHLNELTLLALTLFQKTFPACFRPSLLAVAGNNNFALQRSIHSFVGTES